MKHFTRIFSRFKFEIIFLCGIYLLGLYFRLIPRLKIDPHLLTFNADIWYRLAISQYIYDHGHASVFSIRYLPHALVPEWYPTLFPYFLAFLAKLFRMDLPTATSRVIPFFESITPLSFFLLARLIYGRGVAVLSTLALSLTACFVYWNGIADPQSFITFIMPLLILLWVWYVNNLAVIKRRWLFILIFGVLLAFSFAVHLMYFLMVIILLFVHLSLVMEKKAAFKAYIDLIAAILVSQLATIHWWLPKKLYWWWINGLVTSSGYQAIGKHLNDYGRSALILGLASFLFVIFYAIKTGKNKRYLLLPVFWAIVPLLETQNELILKTIKRLDLTWSPLFKPLEGFRFHAYLAQPLALCIGISVAAIAEVFTAKNKIPALKKFPKGGIYAVFALLLGAVLFYDIWVTARFEKRIQNAGISINEYNAAVWFRGNSEINGLIAADYYRSQMIAGVCGGKAILSLPFPLRNTNVKYVSQREVQKVKDDVYTIYSTQSAARAHDLMKKYGLTHVFISPSLDKAGNFGSSLHKGFGAEINREKFKDATFFDIVYNKDGVLIAKTKDVTRKP